MKRAELAALLAEVDHDGSGEVEYPEFLEIMTVTLQRLADEEDSQKNEGQVRCLQSVTLAVSDASALARHGVQRQQTGLPLGTPSHHIRARAHLLRTGTLSADTALLCA